MMACRDFFCVFVVGRTCFFRLRFGHGNRVGRTTKEYGLNHPSFFGVLPFASYWLHRKLANVVRFRARWV